MTIKDHWENIYTTKQSDQVSWYQAQPQVSLALIRAAGLDPASPVIDVGGGASTLVDFLLEDGFTDITVLDIAAPALEIAKARLGARARHVTWVAANILGANLTDSHYSLWHDRAVFHFLTDPDQRAAYVAAVERSVRPGGYVIVASFAPDGPAQCSGLDVMRYSPDTLHSTFGAGFTLLDSRSESHQTPFGSTQQFIYCFCRKC